MRIGIDARMYGPEVTTGLGMYIKQLVRELEKIDSDNEYILFMLPEQGRVFTPSKNMQVVVADISWYGWEEQIKYTRIIKDHKVELMHFTNFNVPLNYRKPFVVTIHDVTPFNFPGPNQTRSKFHRWAYLTVFKSAVRRAAHVITVSHHTLTQVEKILGESIGQASVTHLGFDPDFNQVSNEELARAKQKFNITKPFLFSVGVWRDHKNFEGLVAAFNLIRSRYNLDYQLVIGGKSDDRYPNIKKAIADSPYNQDIITPGFIDHKDLPALYAGASLYVLPSFAEGFGLVALEAQAVGTPVAAARTSSLPEILASSALYFNPHDSHNMSSVISSLLTDDSRLNESSVLGRENVKRFSWARCAQETLGVYNEIKKED